MHPSAWKMRAVCNLRSRRNDSHCSTLLLPLLSIQDKGEQKALMQKSGELIAEILDDDLAVTD